MFKKGRQNGANEGGDRAEKGGNRVALSRRDLLKWGGGGLASVLALQAPLVSLLVGNRRAPERSQASATLRLRRWAMVIDLRYCDGCVGLGTAPRCTQACIMGHYVPEGMEWIQVFQQELPGGGTQFIPTPCQHCQNAPCVNVCPVGATFATPEGVVLIDQKRCIGCRICMAACPYGRRFFNWGEPVQPPQAKFADYTAERQVPAIKGTTMKCCFCPHEVRDGKLPFCAGECPRKAIYFGDLEEDLATNGEQVVRLSEFLSQNQAYRLKEEMGTKPRVYYIPGHGEQAGRSAYDTRALKQVEWPWRKS